MKPGDDVGRLTTIRETTMSKRKAWLCSCVCGGEIIAYEYSLVSGNTKSCGCLRDEARKIRSTTHAGSGSVTYESWAHMIQRCTNPRNRAWPPYGGRGITVCEAWRSYSSFLLDMGRRPAGGYSLDRIDVNGNYEPENCRWANENTQQRNRRNTKLSPEKVVAIRKLYRKGIYQQEIASRFGVNQSAISKIVRGDLWPDLDSR